MRKKQKLLSRRRDPLRLNVTQDLVRLFSFWVLLLVLKCYLNRLLWFCKSFVSLR